MLSAGVRTLDEVGREALVHSRAFFIGWIRLPLYWNAERLLQDPAALVLSLQFPLAQ